PLIEHTFARQTLHAQRPREFHGFCGDRQVKPRGELHTAQHTQRIFAKLRGSMAQHLSFEIGRALPRINELPGFRVQSHGVDREIPSAGGFPGTEVRFSLNEEVFMRIRRSFSSTWGWNNSRFPSGDRNIDRRAPQFQDSKRSSDLVDLKACDESCSETLRR